jgi:subtilisin family serine protease
VLLAIDYAVADGVVVVFAAGNSNSNAAWYPSMCFRPALRRVRETPLPSAQVSGILQQDDCSGSRGFDGRTSVLLKVVA